MGSALPGGSLSFDAAPMWAGTDAGRGARSAREKTSNEGFLDGLFHGAQPVDSPQLGHGIHGKPVSLQDGREHHGRPAEAGVAVNQYAVPGGEPVSDVAEQLAEARCLPRYAEVRDGVPPE